VPAEPEERTPPVVPEVVPQTPPHRRPVMSPGQVSEREARRIPEALMASRRRVIVARAEKDHASHRSLHTQPAPGSQQGGREEGGSDRLPPETPVRLPDEEIPRSKETERQRIERELRRQRSVAIGGHSPKNSLHPDKLHPAARETQIVHRSTHLSRKSTETQTPMQGTEPVPVSGEKRTIIIGKRKITAVPPVEPPRDTQEKPGAGYPAESASLSDDDGMRVEIRDRIFRARDGVFEGKGVKKPSLPQARDSTLLHTELRPRKKVPEREYDDDNDETGPGQDPRDSVTLKKRTKSDGSDLNRS